MRTGLHVSFLASVVAASGFAAPLHGATAGPTGTALTIYSAAEPGAVSPDLYRPVPGQGVYTHNQGRVPGYAVVREDRMVDLEPGRGELRYSGVAALLDPTTVRFESLTDPDGARVLEQDYRYDLVSPQRLLERYLGERIEVERGDELIAGTLLSATGGIILRTDGGEVRQINGYSGIRYPETPGGLLTRPTLVWDVHAPEGGAHEARVTYQTGGITWWADYNLVYDEGEDGSGGTLDVGAWVSILNQSGGSYENATLKLVAGDVHRAPQPGRRYEQMEMMRAAAAQDAAGGFEEKAFFEYHLYTLGRPTTIPDRSTKQIELFEEARGVPVERVLVYAGQGNQRWWGGGPHTDRNLGRQGNTKVDVYLRFENDEDGGLGIPLPAGRVRVSKVDEADGAMEFIGEDVIDHTPRGEEVLITLGSAFDVVGERVVKDFRLDSRGHWMEEDVEVTLRNRKDEPVEVIVKEALFRWTNWSLESPSHSFEKVDAQTIHFPVEIEPDGEAVITYTARYTW